MLIHKALASIVIVGLSFLSASLIAAPEQPKPETTKPMYSSTGHNITPLDESQIREYAKDLTEEEARIILKKGTEPAFCGNLTDNHLQGTYICRLCKLPLFKSDSKFISGTGWPSFFQPVDPDHVVEKPDNTLGMERTEILCTRCSGHLGHVFSDGPPPTGLRFCVNSASLSFIEKGHDMPDQAKPANFKTAYFAGGCFWGVEDTFAKLPGVIDAVSGYQGGNDNTPTYKEVSTGTTGHAESVMLTYDPAVISYQQLLEHFFKIHNPTQGNRQGPDIGPQYRSMIFTTDEEQLKLAQAFVKAQQTAGKWSNRTITTEIMPAPKFYKAEEYHQDYHARHGGSCAIPD